MTHRRHAREVAFRLLYELEINKDVPEEDLQQDLDLLIRDEEARRFARQLIDGVRARQHELDLLVQEAARNWALSRLGTTERVLLRLGAYEILHLRHPPAVVISEMHRLARRYGSEKSAPFVQGVLNNILRNVSLPSDAGGEAPTGAISASPAQENC